MLPWPPHHRQRYCVPHHLHREHTGWVEDVLIPVPVSAMDFPFRWITNPPFSALRGGYNETTAHRRRKRVANTTAAPRCVTVLCAHRSSYLSVRRRSHVQLPGFSKARTQTLWNTPQRAALASSRTAELSSLQNETYLDPPVR